MNKALFLDLDNTIIKTKSGNSFPKNIKDWEFKKGIIDKIKLYSAANYYVIIVTNQAGINAGYLTEKEFQQKIENIVEAIEVEAKLVRNTIQYFYCKDDNSYNRQPNPGMAYEAALEYELDFKVSIMVGDMQSDKDFAMNAGIGLFIWTEDFIGV